AEFLADELIRRRDANRLFHARHCLERFEACRHIAYSHSADDHSLFSFDGVNLIAKVSNALTDSLDLRFGGVAFHGDDHVGWPSPVFEQNKKPTLSSGLVCRFELNSIPTPLA